MLQNFIRNAAVGLFAIFAKLGLLRLPVFDRIFLRLYQLYKTHFEAGPIDRLREFVPAGSLVVDVGANVGFFSLRFAEWVGNGGEVIAIEPEDQNYNRLVSALEGKGLSNRVRTLKAVAAAAPGVMLLEINPLHPADHKLSRDGVGVAVDAVALDDLFSGEGRRAPSLVKIDVQGAEMMVLEGARKILREYRPALFVELHEQGLRRFGTSVSAILNHLSESGYQGYWLTRTGPLEKADPQSIHAQVDSKGYVDVLFLAEYRA
jgi:FkbM family methyltransferase